MRRSYYAKRMGKRIFAAKRIFACSLAVMLAFGMAACGSKDDDEEYDEEYEEDDEEYEAFEEDSEEDILEQLRKATKAARLPGADDELSQEIAMPLYPELVISYPEQMTVQSDENSNTVMFYSANRAGTFDDYASFEVQLNELEPEEQKYIDSLMEQGPGVAEHYMSELAAMYLRGTYVDYNMEMIEGADVFEDMKDSYVYACPVAVWESGFDDEPEDIYGCVYLKYTGQAGYMVLGCALAPEERADEYLNLGAKIIGGISDDAEFSTESYAKDNKISAPSGKRPEEPEPEEKDEKPAGGTEPSYQPKVKFVDREASYFWADPKGDCWFFDGENDVFWSDKEHGIVDDFGKWAVNPKYEWPELNYSDHLGDNADDFFEYDSEDEDDYWDDTDYEEDYGDEDSEEEYTEDYGEDDEDYDDDDEDEDWDDEDEDWEDGVEYEW